MSTTSQDYKDSKIGIIPQDWEVVYLEDIAQKCSKKNNELKITEVFSNSAINGIVLQNDFFNKDIAQKDNLNGYYIVENGDFVYNPRISKSAPAGPINRNLNKSIGVVSPLYTVFRISSKFNIDFFELYFKSNLWIRYMSSIANYGARHDRMNISSQDFYKMPLPNPSKKEQEKIVNILTIWNNCIKDLKSLIKNKEDLMNSLLINLFSEKKKDWKDIKLQDIFIEHGTKSDGLSEVYSVSVSKGLVNQIEHLGRSYAASDTSSYNLVRSGDIVYTKSPTGNFPFGIIKQNMNSYSCLVSPLYGVFTPKNTHLGYLVHLYFNSSIRTNNYLKPIIQKGAKNTISISNSTFLSKKIYLPINEKEQEKISETFFYLNKEIDLLKQKLKELKLQRRGLMQNLLTGKVRVKV